MEQRPGMFLKPDTWLLDCGYVSENSEQNFLLYGYLSAPGVVAVELQVGVSTHTIKYAIVLSDYQYKKYCVERWFQRRSGLLGKLALVMYLKVFGSIDPDLRIRKCVLDYAGPSWKTSVEVLGVREYNRKADSADGSEGWFFKEGIGADRRVSDGEGRQSAADTSNRQDI